MMVNLLITVTDLANSCATPLFRRPQVPQGCLEKPNHPLSSNFNWTLNLESLKNLRIVKKDVKNDVF